MKKSILTLVVVMLSICSFAQQGPGQRREFNPEEMANRRVERIKQTCNISEEQETKLKELFLAQGKAMEEQRKSAQDASERPRFDREAMQKRMEEQNAAIKQILNEEQFAAYEKAQQEMRQRRPGGMRGGDRPRRRLDNEMKENKEQ